MPELNDHSLQQIHENKHGDSFAKLKIPANGSNPHDTEDEHHPKITPRQSMEGEFQNKETPYNTLVQLAGALNPKLHGIDSPETPTTPKQAEYINYGTPTSRFNPNTATLSQNRRPIRRTPGRPTTLHPLPGKPPKSPHVIRAWEQKFGRVTPGRRKSLKSQAQRDSPLDDLRLLSRLLAPGSKPPPPPTPGTPVPRPHSSPAKIVRRRTSFIVSREFGNRDGDDDDTEELPAAPKMTVDPNTLVDEDNARFEKQPVPRLSAVPRLSLRPGLSPATRSEDGDTTAYSIEREQPRRATSEVPMSKPEFRLSHRFYSLNHAELADASFTDDVESHRDSIGMILGEIDGDSDSNNDEGDFIMGDNTDTLQYQYEDGDTSRFDAGNPSADNSFLLELPPETAEDEQEAEDSFIGNEQSDHKLFLRENLNEVKAAAKVGNGIGKTRLTTKIVKPKRLQKISKHGLIVPSLPLAVIKRLASTFSSSPISKETLDTLVQCTDIFFEKVSTDLASFAKHAKRKTIEDSDVIQLLKRQRYLNGHSTAFSLAEKHLPRELLHEIRMPIQKLERRMPDPR